MLKLKKVLEGRGRSVREYSDLLGVSEKTLYNKLTGATEFTLGEYRKLKTILPEYDLLYLLTEDNSGA